MRLGALILAAATWLVAAPAQAQGSVDEGKKAFNKCRACHSLDAGKNAVGPTLHDVFGRKAGTQPGYKYSAAMIEKGVTWDEQSIAAYLKDPKGYIPGNKMAFPGIKKDSEMQDLMAYLKQATK